MALALELHLFPMPCLEQQELTSGIQPDEIFGFVFLILAIAEI